MLIRALSPDVIKISLVFPDEVVQTLLAVPFSWSPLHTLGGSVLVILLSSLLLASEYRRHVILLVLLGALSHHALDLALLNVSGYSYAVFWPLTEYRPPSGDLYRSSDPWPALVTAAGAALVRVVDRRRS